MQMVLVSQVVHLSCVLIDEEILSLFFIEFAHVDLLEETLLVKGVVVFVGWVDEQVDHVGVVNELAIVARHVGTISVNFGETGVGRTELRILHHRRIRLARWVYREVNWIAHIERKQHRVARSIHVQPHHVRGRRLRITIIILRDIIKSHQLSVLSLLIIVMLFALFVLDMHQDAGISSVFITFLDYSEMLR